MTDSETLHRQLADAAPQWRLMETVAAHEADAAPARWPRLREAQALLLHKPDASPERRIG